MLEKIEIISGPSAEELFLALRLSKERRKTSFGLKVTPENGLPLEGVFEAEVTSIGCHNVAEETWNIQLFFGRRHYRTNSIYKFIPTAVKALYSTYKRTGPVEYDKISHLTPIEDMGMSSRLWKILTKAGIYYIQKLAEWNENDIKKLMHMGKATFNELRDKMNEKGVSFKEN